MYKPIYYIIEWCPVKRMGVPVYSAMFPKSLPKREAHQWYGLVETSINNRINKKGLISQKVRGE